MLGAWPQAGVAQDRTLRNRADVVRFASTLSTGEVVEVPVRIELPARTWRRPGGVQWSVHWEYEDTPAGESDPTVVGHPGRRNLDLEIVDPAGQVVAASRGTDEDTESVRVDAPANGTYTARITAVRADALQFEGRASVVRDPRRDPIRDLLPDLVVLPQRNVRFGPALRSGWPRESQHWIGGCLAEEIAEEGARRCLRFDQSIANRGRGPMELRYSMRDTGSDQLMYQRIRRSDGTIRERPADRYELHFTHLHFHYTSFALSRLWTVDSSGSRTGSVPVREGNKNGFCLIDVEGFGFATGRLAPRTYFGDGCADPDALTLADLTHGISRGWSDLYNWYLPGQYIDIDGLPDGRYLLETIADPRDTVVESDEGNNVTAVVIELRGGVARLARR